PDRRQAAQEGAGRDPLNNRPPGLSDEAVARAVRDGWDFAPVSIAYAAVGFGSHHWIATAADGSRRFVTVDLNDRYMSPGALGAALEAAARLARAGLEFVLAPLRDRDGSVLRRLQHDFTVAVFPYAAGRSPDHGDHRDEGEKRQVLALLERLHRATPAVEDVAARDTLEIANRPELEAAVAAA